jgi:hypothetical protein
VLSTLEHCKAKHVINPKDFRTPILGLVDTRRARWYRIAIPNN